MSDEIKNTVKPSNVGAEPVGAVIPSGTVLSGTTIYNEPWFSVWLPQTFPGTVTGGVAQPTLSGTGYQGANNVGLVFQNDQYNTTVRGF
jgi:hypothetical protein